MCVTLLSIWRLVKNFTAQIRKSFPAGPLTDNQPCSQASTTQLSTLKEEKGRLQLFCLNSQWQIFFPHEKNVLAKIDYGTRQDKPIGRTKLNYQKYTYSRLESCPFMLWCVCQSLSCVRLFVTPWTVACQALQSMRFPRQEYWSGHPLPSPGILQTQTLNLGLPH